MIILWDAEGGKPYAEIKLAKTTIMKRYSLVKLKSLNQVIFCYNE